jgi:hypothetical protein
MTGVTFTTTQTFKIADRSSAEWIAEAPGIPTLPLADFGTVTFRNAEATLKHTGRINDPGWAFDRIGMAWSSGLIRAEALPLSLDGTSFSENWVRLWTQFLCKERRLFLPPGASSSQDDLDTAPLSVWMTSYPYFALR